MAHTGFCSECVRGGVTSLDKSVFLCAQRGFGYGYGGGFRDRKYFNSR